MLRSLTWEEVLAWQDAGRPFVLLDVRDAEEVAAAPVLGTRHLPVADLPRYAPQVLPDPSQSIVCFCRGGRRSAAAVRWLEAAGYQDVWNVPAGYFGYPGSHHA